MLAVTLQSVLSSNPSVCDSQHLPAEFILHHTLRSRYTALNVEICRITCTLVHYLHTHAARGIVRIPSVMTAIEIRCHGALQAIGAAPHR